MIISSNSNQIVVATKKLFDKKYRQIEGKYVIEGDKLVKEALRYKVVPEYLIVNEKLAEIYSDFPCEVIVATQSVVDSICDTITNQGVVGVVKIPNTTVKVPKGRCLILDCLQDPGNMGTIIRTAAATGYNDIYLNNCVDPFSPKVVRSAMAGQFCVDIFVGSLDTIFEAVKQKCQIVCADMDGTNIFNTKVEKNHAILIGNEGNGVSDKALKECDIKISLPMQNDFESLNASVSAGIIMYQLSNR